MKKIIGGVLMGVLIGKAMTFKRKRSIVEKLLRNPDNFVAKAYVKDETVIIEIKEKEES